MTTARWRRTPGVIMTAVALATAALVLAVGPAAHAAGPATHLVFTAQPGDGVPGVALDQQPVVEIRDVDGLVVDDDTTEVSLALVPDEGGPGALTCTPVVAVDGVAEFTDCAVDALGLGYQLVATSNPALTEATSESFDILPQRIFGPDEIDTSIAVSQAAFPDDESADVVVLARSDFFTDALAGGPLAADNNGPLLITRGAPQSSILDPRVRDEILRVLPEGEPVFVLGGPQALAPAIDTQLEGLGYVPIRVAGANQFATAVAIAGELGDPSTIFEATGLHFADALSAVPAAIKSNGAILLTNGPVQAPETAAYLAANPSVRFAIGGPLAAAGADPSAVAVFGQDLYGTSAAVAATFFPNPAVFGVATGVTFQDALSGGSFMATDGRSGPMLLVNTHAPLPLPIASYISGLGETAFGWVFGGPVAVGDDVLEAIASLFS